METRTCASGDGKIEAGRGSPMVVSADEIAGGVHLVAGPETERRSRLQSLLVCVLFCSACAAAGQSPGTINSNAAAAGQQQTPSVNTAAPQATPQAANQVTTSGATSPSGEPAGDHASPVTDPRPALGTSVWSKAGVTVTAVRFDGVTFAQNDVIFSQLKQKQGQPLDPEKVRDDLRRLFASGRYRDIQVSGEQTGDGLTLVFAGSPRYYVGRIAITGVPSERLTSLLEFATKMDPGTAYTDAMLPAALDSLKETLASNGFYQPVVSVGTTLDSAGHQVNAAFAVALGPQARVGQIAIEGKDPGITVPEFRKAGGLNCSRLARVFNKHCEVKVVRETTSNALAGVRTKYQSQDRLEGTISLQKSTYAPARKQLDYDFAANQGPVVKVEVEGTKLSKSRKKLLVPVYEEGAVDNDLLNEGAFNIREYLQQKGYFNATDSVVLTGDGTKNVTVTYMVDPGQEHRVTAVNIEGNKYLDRDTLGDLLRVKKGDAYARSGKYSTQLVAADVTSIESMYRANGFSKVKVTSSVKDIDKAANGKDLKTASIQVTFSVVEGPQQKFGAVDVTGVDKARETDVKGLLSSQNGQPFSLLNLATDRDAILGYYLARGFDHAKVEISQEISPVSDTLTDVALNVTEGQQVFIDQVLLSGVVRTRPKLVESQVLVHAGDPLDQAALLQTQRNLYNLALFNEVNAAVQNPTGDAPTKNVLVQVTEARRWDVTYGAGFEAQTGTPAVVPGGRQGGTAAQNGKAGISPRVSIDVSRINLRGTQNSLTLHATYGLLERIATLSFNVPQFLNHPNLTASFSAGYSNVQNITTFASSTEQVDARLVQKVKRADTFIYDFQYRRVSVDPNSLEVTPNLIPQLSEPVTVGGPQITWFHDTRDPSPLDAHKGQYISVQEFIASKYFGSDTTFNRLDVSQATYYQFGKKKYVFARNTRVGFEHFFGANPNATATYLGVPSTACLGNLINTNPSCDPVPLPERMYAGGATSHRGFGINSAGPRDLTTGFPVGGEGVVVNTFELRLPPPTLPIVGDSVSFVVFHDMGNVFQNAGDMFKSIKNFKQPNEQVCKDLADALVVAHGVDANAVGTCNFNYYSHAVGLGARYNTPVGPIRLDFSYNLNPPVYPVFDDYTSTGPHVGKGGHFNFFFSIGQAF